MPRRAEDVLFPLALAVSLAGHAAVPFLRWRGEREVAPQHALDEREARTPMTVRVVLQEMLRPPVLAAEAPPPVLTAEGGERRVWSVEPQAQEFTRERDAVPPPVPAPLADLEEPTTRDPEPLEELLDLPERPQERETPPPEPPSDLVPTPRDAPEPALRDQQGVSGVATEAQPDAGRNEPPDYPRRALAARMEGVVELEVEVRADGRVESVRVKVSSGHTLLDDEALKTVKRWRFTPARDAAGEAVPSVVPVPVRFRLTDRR